MVVDGGDGGYRAASHTLDRSAGNCDDRRSQPARWDQPRLFREILLGVDVPSLTRHVLDQGTYPVSLLYVSVDSLAGNDGFRRCNGCFITKARPKEAAFRNWYCAHGRVLRFAWNQSVRQWNCGAPAV